MKSKFRIFILCVLAGMLSISASAQKSTFQNRLDKAKTEMKKAQAAKTSAEFNAAITQTKKYLNAANNYATTASDKKTVQNYLTEVGRLRFHPTTGPKPTETTEPKVTESQKPSRGGWSIHCEEDNHSIVLKNGATTVSYTMVAIDAGTTSTGKTIQTFALGQTEVTQLLWDVVMKSGKGSESAMKPVTNVSWDECNTFIDRLNTLTNGRFRLPEDYEWEYAASGGDKSQGFTYSGSNKVSDVAWTDQRLHPVKGKKPNELGLYDMSGNVWEWTNSRYDSDRVVKGGSFYEAEATSDYLWKKLKPTAAEHQTSNYKSNYYGFRLAMSL